MSPERFLFTQIVFFAATLVCGPASFAYGQSTTIGGHGQSSDASRPEVSITRMGEFDAADFDRDEAVVFVRKEEFIEGRVTGARRRLFAQLIARTGNNRWHVTQGFARTNPLEPVWKIPAANVGCEDTSEIVEIRAVLTRELLSVGTAEDPLAWDGILSSSRPVLISCARFEHGWLQVMEVAWHQPRPRVVIPVSEIEPVRISCEGLPPGAHVQVVVESLKPNLRWVMPDAGTACSGGPREINTQVHFGRTLPAGNGQIIELDLNTKYALSAVASTKLLPVYDEDRGITPEEWSALSRFVQVESPKVYVDRTVLGTGARLRIEQLGWSNDQQRFIASRYGQVSGSFETGKNYVQPSTPETVALLVRSSDEGSWHIAGQTQMIRDRGHWIIHLARLVEPSSDLTRPFIAIAAAFQKPVDARQPISETMLDAAIGISEEVSFRIVPRK
jgi:hypothetical protein